MTQGAKGGKPKRGAEQLAVQKRRQDALDLHSAGVPQAKIAEKYGVDVSIISKDIKIALAAIPRKSAEQYRDLHLNELAKYRSRLEAAVRQGDPRSIQVAANVLDREAKLLGLEAPQRVEVSGGLDVDATIRQLVQESARLDEALAERAHKLVEGTESE